MYPHTHVQAQKAVPSAASPTERPSLDARGGPTPAATIIASKLHSQVPKAKNANRTARKLTLILTCLQSKFPPRCGALRVSAFARGNTPPAPRESLNGLRRGACQQFAARL